MGDLFERYFNDTQPQSDRLRARLGRHASVFRACSSQSNAFGLRTVRRLENRRYGRLENLRYDCRLKTGEPYASQTR